MHANSLPVEEPNVRITNGESYTWVKCPANVPTVLQEYLTTTSRPHEIYAALQESRDRRLRLLLRRFTNQIQYGCKNPYCEVSTCLSYRKRHSQVPTRPYNDIAARSLAWRCVEDYATAGRIAGTSEESGLVSRRKGKSKPQQGDRKDGLCWSEPVVPWYEDPDDYARRRKSTLKRQNILETPPRKNVTNLTETCRQMSPRKSRSDSTTVSMVPKERACDVSEYVQETVDYTGSGSEMGGRTINASADGSQIPEHPYSEHILPSSSPKVGEVHTPSKDTAILSPAKDTASFLQSLSDTLSVKILDKLKESTKVCDAEDLHPESYKRSGKTALTHQSPKTGIPGTMKTSKYIGQTITFKLLPTSALIWLRYAVSRIPDPQDQDALRFGDRLGSAVGLDDFAKQSLHFSLGNPSRLMISAHMWQYNRTHRDIKKEQSTRIAFKMLNEVVTEIAQTESEPIDQAGSLRLPTLKIAAQAYTLMSKIQPYSTILSHIFASLQHAYVLPSSLKQKPYTMRREAGADEVEPRYLDDRQTAHLCMIVMSAMFNVGERMERSPLMPWDYWPDEITRRADRAYQDNGTVFSDSYLIRVFGDKGGPESVARYRSLLMRIDANTDPHFLRLLEGFADVISHRIAVTQSLHTAKGNVLATKKTKNIVDRIIDLLITFEEAPKTSDAAWGLRYLMSLVLLKMWDRGPIVQRIGAVGGALQMMAGLYRNRARFGIPAICFAFNFVSDSFDEIKMPLSWLTFREDSKQMHILSYSFLFKPRTLVKFFRAMNAESMQKSFQYAAIIHADARRFLQHEHLRSYGGREVLDTMRPHMARYFVLTASRNDLVEDAINQIWRRQRQELMRPLKVILGKNEGEDGLDHGGVQQEFFRLFFAQVMNPDYGMFTIDDRTRMTWFQAGSLEPLYKFEAIGVLMSLAVYNGITLPLTFPLALYRKLLHLKVKQLEHIEDGWPDLANGLKVLQEWEDGDVGDVIARTYEFSYEVFGSAVNVDMTRVGRDDPWPRRERRKSKDRIKTATFEIFNNTDITPPSEPDQTSGKPSSKPFGLFRTSSQEIPRSPTPLSILSTNTSLLAGVDSSSDSPKTPLEAPLVTNDNRNQYIKDYIYWLTDKSIAPQFEAFAKGFYTCLDPTALSIFTPEALQSVVEGHTEIDVSGLQATATYDEYSTQDQIIQDFWTVVRDFSPEQHAKLLEFVTASDRVPVNGIESVTFLIQKNGEGDERLPSSSTCYGRLLLPAYSSKEVLREKLEKAIENSVGFGSL